MNVLIDYDVGILSRVCWLHYWRDWFHNV